MLTVKRFIKEAGGSSVIRSSAEVWKKKKKYNKFSLSFPAREFPCEGATEKEWVNTVLILFLKEYETCILSLFPSGKDVPAKKTEKEEFQERAD